MIEVLVGAQGLEEFLGVRRPARDVESKLFEHHHGALAAPIADRVGDLGPPGDRGRQAMDRAIADQVADIGQHPFGTGLDEGIIVEPRRILLEDTRRLGQHAQELPQRIALRRIACPMDSRQQREQGVCVPAHGITVSESRGPGSSVRSSAARNEPSGRRIGGSAGRRTKLPGVPVR